MTDTETARILARFDAMQRDHFKAMQSFYGSISSERKARAAFKARWGITWTQASDLIHALTCAPLEGDE